MYNSLTGDFTEISQTVDEITGPDICLFCYGWYNPIFDIKKELNPLKPA